MNFDSIIFDLDGTLWDSSASCTVGWNIELDKHPEYNIHLSVDDIKGVMGLSLDDIEKKLLGSIEDKEYRHKLRIACGQTEMEYLRRAGGNLFENLENTLDILSKKYKLYIVSNCEEGYIQSFFYYHKLEKYFEDIEYWGRTGKNKSENIRLVIERNNLKSAVYVGDTQGDCNASEKAGIPFIHAAYGFGKVEGKILKSIEKLSDLPMSLESL